MVTLGVRTSLLSCILKDPASAASLARKANEHAASILRSQPNPFGFLASLPSFYDTEPALAKIRYAFDELHAGGVTLFTQYDEGDAYLGTPAFALIWKELDRKEAVVFIHPTHPVDTELFNPRIPQPVIDYPHETTRTAVDLIMAGTKRRYSRFEVILSHAGGRDCLRAITSYILELCTYVSAPYYRSRNMARIPSNSTTPLTTPPQPGSSQSYDIATFSIFPHLSLLSIGYSISPRP